MKTLLHAIDDIVRPTFRRDGVIELREEDRGSRCRPVTLHKSGQALVLKLDGLLPPLCALPGCQLRYSVNDRLFPLFKVTSEGLTAICDYVVFYQETSRDAPVLFVFLCELKSGAPHNARKQAENGRLLADYIVEMARHHGKVSSTPRIERRGLIFGPRFELPKIANPIKNRCAYEAFSDGMRDLKFSYCRDGADYPLVYFCT